MYIYFVVSDDHTKTTIDEGIIALSNLPKLESLDLCDITSFTYQVFKHFKKLKKLRCCQIENIKDGVRDLLQHCSNIQEISIFYHVNCEIIEVIKCAAETLKHRISDIPLLVTSDFDFPEAGFRVRMIPIKSAKDSTKKLLFHLFYGKQKVTPDFITYDLDILIKEAKLLIEQYIIANQL